MVANGGKLVREKRREDAARRCRRVVLRGICGRG